MKERIYFRITAEDKVRIEKKAEPFGGVSYFLRNLALNRPDTPVCAREFIDTINSFSARLVKVETNINQIAKAMNVNLKVSKSVRQELIKDAFYEIKNYNSEIEELRKLVGDILTAKKR